MYSFYAMLFRQKYMRRWSMMRNVTEETLSEHSMECAVLAHALAVIGNTVSGKSYNADHVAVVALYHDAPEVYTSDLPTPVKYFDEDMRKTYAKVEEYAIDTLLGKLPKQVQQTYRELLICTDPETEKLVKMADKLCAYIKCLQELKSGNMEFKAAAESTLKKINEYKSEELAYFLEHCLPAFEKNIDEL